MARSETDTIVAEATPRGRGGVGVVRISGPNTVLIAQKLLKKVPLERKGEYGAFWDEDGTCLDQGIALFFKGPASFTGEDVLELQGHGGPIIMDSLIRASVSAGARLAEPGEFSLRAFLNNKIDLIQAEAISELINAQTEAAARSALRSLQGAFSERIETVLFELIELRMYVEATIDFPEEEIDFLSDGKIEKRLKKILLDLDNIEKKAKQGALVSDGIRIAIIGKPNAGKSSLLNALSGYDRAIVTERPGTTRDILKEHINLDGLLIHLVDTAGLRLSEDIVEAEGIQRALQEMSKADHLILMIDGTLAESDPAYGLSDWLPDEARALKMTVLYNKIDKLNGAPKIEEQGNHTVISLSVKTGEGLELLKAHLKKVAGFNKSEEGDFIARRRHIEALKEAEFHLKQGYDQLIHFKAGELLAEELRQAQIALDQITGKFTSDDLLGKIFSEFCIGK